MKEFRIIYTSDIHGHLFSKIGEVGLETTFPEFHKDGNTIVIDGGDLLQGGSTGAFLSERRLQPNPIADLMNRAGYDAMTLGNHDCNFGIDYLGDFLKQFKGVCLCANIRDKEGKLPIQNWRIFTLQNGLRIGVIGICTPVLDRWEKPEILKQLSISSAVGSAVKAAKEIEGKCDVTVGLYHGGFESDSQRAEDQENQANLLCRTLKLDILLTAHQHICDPGRMVGDTWVIQPGRYGQVFAEIKGSVFDDGKVAVSSRLIKAPSPNTLNPAYDAVRSAIQEWEDGVLCTLPEALPVADRVEMALHGSALAEFINRIQMEVMGTQISATNLSNTALGLPQRVSIGDVYRCYTSSYSLCCVDCDGATLREALERTAHYLTKTDGGFKIDEQFLKPKERLSYYDFYTGIDYKFDFTLPPGKRLVYLRFHGKDIQPEDHFPLCITNYRCSGGDGYYMFTKCPVLSANTTPVVEHMLSALKKLR